MTKQAVSIFWFRRDLRLHDNHGLYQALKSGHQVVPVFIFDKNILGSLQDPADRRVHFIHQTLETIQQQLVSMGSSLHLLHQTPEAAFEVLTQMYQIHSVYTNHDYEPYATERDEKVRQYLQQKNIVLHTYKDQVIFEKNEVIKSDGKPYTIYTPYSKLWKSLYLSQKKERYPSEKHTDAFLRMDPVPIPSLAELGFVKTDGVFPSVIPDEDIIRKYAETRNIPSVDGTAKMSVHLRFGTVSVRELAAKALKWNETWLNELIWREFFMMILWHFPEVVTSSFKPKYDRIVWRNNPTEFTSWCRGETGYPLVDAGMRELNATGLMHNRVRMVTASFLTKHLLVDWRWGEAYFAEKLLDYELSSNNGNWQWSAGCGCDAAPYFRIFNPTEQQKKFDPELKYVRRWIPEYKEGYLEEIVEHKFARERVLSVFKRGLEFN